MIKNKIGREEPWKESHNPKDYLHPTHTIIEDDAPFGLYNIAIQLPPEEVLPVMRLMDKEVDAANRFSLTDGIIQGEFELWDGDFEKRLYFCVDFTLKQAIKFSEQKRPAIGYVPVEIPHAIIGAQKIFRIEDLQEIIKIKIKKDSDIHKPLKWKVG